MLIRRVQEIQASYFCCENEEINDTKAQLLRMKKLFRLHDYSDNMKANITTFILNEKEDIRWEDVKNVRGIKEAELVWDEF